MYFLINPHRKIIFGWSAKSGCNHVKVLFNYYSNINNLTPHKEIHRNTYNKLPPNHKAYTIILFVRNPFSRLVSGYVEKYAKQPNNKFTTFENFIVTIYRTGLQYIDKHHFTPQLSEAFHPSIKPTKVYDIGNIDYDYLDTLFQKKVPEHIKNIRGKHCVEYTKTNRSYCYNRLYRDYKGRVPTFHYFYNEKIKNVVLHLYQADFKYFKTFGLDYINTTEPPDISTKIETKTGTP